MRWWLGVSAWVGVVVSGCGAAPPERGTETLSVDPAEIELLSAEARLVAVRAVAMDSESVWVLDGAAPFLTRIALAEGRSVQAVRDGRGPGEFLDPVELQPVVDSAGPGVGVWDLGNRRVSVFDTFGIFCGSEPLSDEGGIRARTDFRYVSYADPYRVRRQGDTTVAGFFPRRLDFPSV
jgi:hypothetical protein